MSCLSVVLLNNTNGISRILKSILTKSIGCRKICRCFCLNYNLAEYPFFNLAHQSCFRTGIKQRFLHDPCMIDYSIPGTLLQHRLLIIRNSSSNMGRNKNKSKAGSKSEDQNSTPEKQELRQPPPLPSSESTKAQPGNEPKKDAISVDCKSTASETASTSKPWQEQSSKSFSTASKSDKKFPPLEKSQSDGPKYSRPQFRTWNQDWDEIKVLPLLEKRKMYSCSNYVTLQEVVPWENYAREKSYRLHKVRPSPEECSQFGREFSIDETLNKKVALFTGDITSLEIDAIVNAANTMLYSGGGVCGAIHSAAGPSLEKQCRSLNGCQTGYSKLTHGYRLPAKHVIQTVGPTTHNTLALSSCYFTSMTVALEAGCRSIAFPCVSTGIFGFSNESAVKIALPIIREALEKYGDHIDRVIFCLFMEVDMKLYDKYMQVIFPVKEKQEHCDGGEAQASTQV